MTIKKMHGLLIDADAIGRGVYEMICDKGEQAIVAFGMIPKWSIDLLHKSLRDKVIAEAAQQVAATPDDLTPYVDDQRVEAIVRDIEHEVCVTIYRAASQAGAMVV